MPTRIRNLDNSDAGGALQNKFVLQYNHSLNRFVLIPANTLLARTVDNSDIDDTFVEQLQEELDVDRINVLELDGGSF